MEVGHIQFFFKTTQNSPILLVISWVVSIPCVFEYLNVIKGR